MQNAKVSNLWRTGPGLHPQIVLLAEVPVGVLFLLAGLDLVLDVEVARVPRLRTAVGRASLCSAPRPLGAPVDVVTVRGGPACAAPASPLCWPVPAPSPLRMLRAPRPRTRDVGHGHDGENPCVAHPVTAHHSRLRLQTQYAHLNDK